MKLDATPWLPSHFTSTAVVIASENSRIVPSRREAEDARVGFQAERPS
jgi:hypothetical protein